MGDPLGRPAEVKLPTVFCLSTMLQYFLLEMVIYAMPMADLTSLSIVSIVSYNCRGFNALKTRYFKSLLSKTFVLFFTRTLAI